ncbi:cupin domain-containing protein [Lysinibacillus xylanilyticus]|uniref:cupin domain-containing protein n=1 Tax=Lysinibacillus xylanilyticus TaxID=582475 RepID=UPI002B3A07E0|nr:cupin domain-containing protein [Lysinibacillus xylanilyticus]
MRSIHINLSPFKKSLYFIIPNDEDSSEDSTILKQRKHKYDGHEFIYIVEGELTVIIEEQEFVLKENESKMFDARKIHYWYNYQNKPVKFLLVSSQ